MARDVCPSADLNESLGAANQRWKKVYVGEVVEEESNFISRLVTKLASKAAISVSSLSKESIFYRLLSYALDASGVEFNFNNANAWYICFGDLLGGLIIQGGQGFFGDTKITTVTYPITFYQMPAIALGNGDFYSQNWAGYGFEAVKKDYAQNQYLSWVSIGR